jgi:hypothetical protein
MSPILKLRALPLAVLIYPSFSSQSLIRGFGFIDIGKEYLQLRRSDIKYISLLRSSG